jgi:hypothetical protein
MLATPKPGIPPEEAFDMHLLEPDQRHVISVPTPSANPAPFQQGDNMSEEVEDTGPVPLMQQLLDNPFLLLFLGVLIPMVVYTLWGVIDILTIPLAK